MDYIGSLKQDTRDQIHGTDAATDDTPHQNNNIPPASILDNYPDTTINPYEYMGIERDAKEADIKRAYKKGALRWHPDKHPPEQKSKAQKAFQRLTTAYAVLVDPIRRKHYDATGKIHDALHMDSDDPWRWQPFYQHCWAKMAHGDIEAFAKEYRFSEEERQDLLKQYTLRKGDMGGIYEHVTLSNPLDDDERYRKLINEAIKNGEVKAYKTFTHESMKTIKSRKDKAKKEAQEAEEMKAMLQQKGIWFEPPSNHESEDLLALSIQAKNKSRSIALLDRLMDKYVTKPGKKNGTEPSEEAFEKNRKKGLVDAIARDKVREQKKVSENRQKRRATEVEDEKEEEVAEKMTAKRWNEKRKRVKRQMEEDEAMGEEESSGDEEVKKVRKEDEIWGEPAKAETKAKAKAPIKKAPVKKAKAKVPPRSRVKKAVPTRAIVESESEDGDDAIDLGSQDSESGDDEEEFEE